ncbi:chalcone isomerase family protein [uncultured Endozoicomonas sp.]|uniref:chalcone isomerase family protein n=1 Tax=uncultured Endozoicomonas sp. TaxID=432652 RepID=UPI002637BD62|nr:chalcone isomerase family protein [uncultured Endozoicomonas sp.]
MLVQMTRQLLLGAIFLITLPMSANALIVNDYDLPDVISADGGDSEIYLQGASVRSWYLMVKGYIGALYLAEPTSNPEEIYASQGYQRMAFVMLVSKMSARRIANAFYESIQLNTPPAEQEEMKDEIAELLALVDGSMKRGDQAVFEYLPDQGVRIEIAGEEKGMIAADKRLFNLILRVWIGETPPSKTFKDEILGLAPVG